VREIVAERLSVVKSEAGILLETLLDRMLTI
jgi:hypothetical protein